MSSLDRFRYKPRTKQVPKSPTFSGSRLSGPTQDSDVTCIPETPPSSSSSHGRFSGVSQTSQSQQRGYISQDSSQNSPTFYAYVASRQGGKRSVHSQLPNASPDRPVQKHQNPPQKQQTPVHNSGVQAGIRNPSRPSPVHNSGVQAGIQNPSRPSPVHNSGVQAGIQNPSRPSPSQSSRRLQYPAQRSQQPGYIPGGTCNRTAPIPVNSPPVPRAIHRVQSPTQTSQGQRTPPHGVVAYSGNVRRQNPGTPPGQPVRRMQQPTHRLQTSVHDPGVGTKNMNGQAATGGVGNNISGQVTSGYQQWPVNRPQTHRERSQVSDTAATTGRCTNKRILNHPIGRSQNLAQRSRSQESIGNHGATTNRMQRHNSFPSQAVSIAQNPDQRSQISVGSPINHSGGIVPYRQIPSASQPVQCIQNTDLRQRFHATQGNTRGAIQGGIQTQYLRITANQSSPRMQYSSHRPQNSIQYSKGTSSGNIRRQSVDSYFNQSVNNVSNQPANRVPPHYSQRSQSSTSDSDNTYISGFSSQPSRDVNLNMPKDLQMQQCARGRQAVSTVETEIEIIPDSDDEDDVSIIEEKPSSAPQNVVQLSPITITNVISGHAVRHPSPSRAMDSQVSREGVRRSLHPWNSAMGNQGNQIGGDGSHHVNPMAMVQAVETPCVVGEGEEVEDLSDIEEIVDDPGEGQGDHPPGMNEHQVLPVAPLGMEGEIQEEESMSDVEEIVDSPKEGQMGQTDLTLLPDEQFVEQVDAYAASQGDDIEEVELLTNVEDGLDQAEEFDDQGEIFEGTEAYDEHAADLEQVEMYDKQGNYVQQDGVYDDQENYNDDSGVYYEQQNDVEEVEQFDPQQNDSEEVEEFGLQQNDLEQAGEYGDQENYEEEPEEIIDDQENELYYESQNDLGQAESYDEQQEPYFEQDQYYDQSEPYHTTEDLEQVGLYEEDEMYEEYEDDLQPDGVYEQTNDFQQVHTDQQQNQSQQLPAHGKQKGLHQDRELKHQGFQQVQNHQQQQGFQQVQNCHQQRGYQQAQAAQQQLKGSHQAQNHQQQGFQQAQAAQQQLKGSHQAQNHQQQGFQQAQAAQQQLKGSHQAQNHQQQGFQQAQAAQQQLKGSHQAQNRQQQGFQQAQAAQQQPKGLQVRQHQSPIGQATSGYVQQTSSQLARKSQQQIGLQSSPANNTQKGLQQDQTHQLQDKHQQQVAAQRSQQPGLRQAITSRQPGYSQQVPSHGPRKGFQQLQIAQQQQRGLHLGHQQQQTNKNQLAATHGQQTHLPHAQNRVQQLPLRTQQDALQDSSHQQLNKILQGPAHRGQRTVQTIQQRSNLQQVQTYSQKRGSQLTAKAQQQTALLRVQPQSRQSDLQQAGTSQQIQATQNQVQSLSRQIDLKQAHLEAGPPNLVRSDGREAYPGGRHRVQTEHNSAQRNDLKQVDTHSTNNVVDKTYVGVAHTTPPKGNHTGSAGDPGNYRKNVPGKTKPVGNLRGLQWNKPRRVLTEKDIALIAEELRGMPRDEHRRNAKDKVRYQELAELAEDQRRQLGEMFPNHSKKDLRRAIEQSDGSLSIAASVLVDLPASDENSEEELPDPFSPSKKDRPDDMAPANVVVSDEEESDGVSPSKATSQNSEQTPDMVRPSRRRKRILHSEDEGDSDSDSSEAGPPSKQRRSEQAAFSTSTPGTNGKGPKSLLSKFAYNGEWVSKASHKEQKSSPKKSAKATSKKKDMGIQKKSSSTPSKGKKKIAGRRRRQMISSDEDEEYEEDFVVQDDTLSENENTEEEEEAVTSSEDEDQEDEYHGSAQFSESFQADVLEFFNGAPRQELENLAGCSRTKAERILEIRPFHDFNDVVEKLDATKTLSSYLIESCEDLFGERKLLTEILNDCCSISDKIQGALTEEDKTVDKGYQMTFLDSSLSLKPYQLVGVNWMRLLHKHKINGILADEMGLGKTIQVIAFLASLLEEGKEGPHLIIAPSSTLDNWLREFNKWAPSMEAILYTGDRDYRLQLADEIRNGDLHCNVLITSYNIATGEHDYKRCFRKLKLQYSVYDEGHMLKNIKSLRFKSLMKIKSQQKLLLTGTPLQNNLLELMSLISFVVPKLDSPEKMQTLQRLFSMVTGGDDSTYIQDRIRQAKQIMQPFVLRRVKDQVLAQLPAKIIQVEVCPMDPRQEGYYRDLKTNYQKSQELRAVVGHKPGDKTTLGALMELRKLANHPLLMRRLYTDEMLAEMSKLMLREPTHYDASATLIEEDMGVMSDFELHLLCKQYASVSSYRLEEERIRESGKFRALDRILPKLKEQGLKVLLFSQFTMMLDILEPYMKQCKHNYLRMDGATSVIERSEIMDKFISDPNIFVFLLSTKACGLGINLTIANTVILHDIDFNPHNDKQAEDRCHRLGQTRNVTVVKLVSQGTIDETMLQRAEQKLNLERQMISGEDVDGVDQVSIDALLKESLNMS